MKVLSGVSNPQPAGHMRPMMAMNVAQHEICKFTSNLFFAQQFSLVFVYLMCGPGQLIFFQCGPEMPNGWTPLLQANGLAGKECLSLVLKYTT